MSRDSAYLSLLKMTPILQPLQKPEMSSNEQEESVGVVLQRSIFNTINPILLVNSRRCPFRTCSGFVNYLQTCSLEKQGQRTQLHSSYYIIMATITTNGALSYFQTHGHGVGGHVAEKHDAGMSRNAGPECGSRPFVSPVQRPHDRGGPGGPTNPTRVQTPVPATQMELLGVGR